MHRLSRLLLYPVELFGPGLVRLPCHAAGDDVLGQLLLHELCQLAPVAAVEDLGNVLGETLAQEYSVVMTSHKPVLVDPELVLVVFIVVLADQLACEGQDRPLDTFCLWSTFSG